MPDDPANYARLPDYYRYRICSNLSFITVDIDAIINIPIWLPSSRQIPGLLKQNSA
jgi:hypothetical protein